MARKARKDMKILDMPCTKGFMQLAQDGVDKGWHEMNGGNLSYRLTKDEAANVKKVMKKASGTWQDICESVPKLAGEFFMVTRTTGYMRNVMRNPENAFGIVEIDSTGTKYRIWWGLSNGGRPTSEFPSHLKNHEVKLETTGGEHRVIYHAHPVNLIALTFVLPPTDKAFTRALWEIMTECPVIFPEGVGVVPWMVPGKGPIAAATSKLMRDYNIVVWVHHGLFVSGRDFDRCFGLMDTVEKAAEIRIRAQSTGAMKKSAIQVRQLRQIAKDFGFTLNEKFL
jgi:rhamnulose-1-phosphate aldolase